VIGCEILCVAWFSIVHQEKFLAGCILPTLKQIEENSYHVLIFEAFSS